MSADTVRQTAEEVLRRPYYKLDVAQYDFSFLRRISDFLEWLLTPLTTLFSTLHEVSPVLAWVVTLGLLVIAVALIVHIVYSFKQAFSVRKRSTSFMESDQEAKLNPKAWEQKADEAFKEGNYVLALRFLLKACIMRLEKSYGRRPRPAATNREHLRLFKDEDVLTPLSFLVDMIDVKWYGGRPCTQTDYEQGADAHTRIRDLTTRGTIHAHRT